VILADLIDEFPATIRGRGAHYYRTGAARITASSADSVSAVVSGSRRYDVGIEVQNKRLLLFCSCPYFFSDGPCKHLWAAALAADKAGLLRALQAFDEVADVTGVDPDAAGDEEALDSDADDTDDTDDVDTDDDTADDNDPPAVLPGRGLRSPPRVAPVSAPYRRESPPRPQAPQAPQPAWKRFLDLARAASPAEPPRAPILAGELLYVVDVGKTLSDGSLMLALLERSREKDGTWAKLRPPRIAITALGHVPDERDRRALPLLHGAGALGGGMPAYFHGYSSGYGSYQRCFSTEIALPLSVAEVVMPLLSETGRLFVRRGQEEDLEPARWDGGAPWELELQLRARDAGSGTELAGRLCRGDERADLDDPLVVTAEGWLVLPGRIGRFDHFGCFGLVSLLRQRNRVEIPASQQKAFLAELLEQPGLPRLDLPRDLALRETTAPPRPELAIGRPEPRTWRPSSGRPAARLAFSYQGRSVADGDPRQAVALPDDGILIRRDRQAEAAAEARLHALGFRRERSSRGMSDGPGRFAIAPRKLPAAVRALVAEGWHVEAEGKLYRTAGGFEISVKSGIDWFDVSATADFGGVTASLPELLRALRSGEQMIVLGDGSLGMLPEEWLARYGALAGLASVEGERLRFRRSQVGVLDALLASQPAVSVDRVFARARQELASFAGVAPEMAPHAFRGELRPYQEAGLGWLAFLRRFGLGGCLADDMGLGKTVQVLAMLAGRRGGPKRPSLAVVPKSLVWNWQQEAARFTPRLRVLAHVGAGRAATAEAFASADLVLTTYGTLRADVGLLGGIDFDYVILDEAQAIKNADSGSARAARLLRGRHRLALSGTPIENHVGELWSLFEFLNPGMLGAARAFEGITRHGRPSPETLAVLSRALKPFILRRTKREVAPELPAKHEETILCELDPPQRRLYDELRAHYRARLLGRGSEDGIGKAKIQVLEALLRLRQAACHPGLIDKRRAQEACGKLDVLLPRLDELAAEGHKALVFSQFTSFLALLRSRLDAQKIPYEYLDGDVEDRAERVARFQGDPGCRLFLISLKAGGVGLNLTAADYVFILDPWWNPAVEAQAVDRTHRIGQDKQVFVYRLLCRDTVEEKVAALQESKRGLAESIITNSGSLMRDLDRETLELLLS
jgi:superfamily II DNA or RNA helicase